MKGGDLSPLSSYDGDGIAPIEELPSGDGFSLVPILRRSAIDDALVPTAVELPTDPVLAERGRKP